MSEPLHIDLETRGVVDLRKVGAHRYAEDRDTSIILGSARMGATMERFRGNPVGLKAYIEAGGRMIGHNQQFERVMLRAAGIEVSVEQQDCTMARAATMGLPASLENLGAAIDADIQKDKDGHRLMLKMCKPRTLDPLTWHEDPNEIERLQAYCDQDVLTECAIDARLPPLSDRERRVWELDQTINDRGVAIDLPLVRRAQDAVAKAKKAADDRIWRLTNGAVRKTTEAKKIVDWLAARGIATKSIADSEMDDLLIATEMFDDETAAAALALRRASSKAFVFQAMLDTVCRDGRIRGSRVYHKAHTGRWAGSGPLTNLKRVEDEEDEAAVVDVLNALQTGGEISSLNDLSLAARGMMIAPPGKKLVGGDFKNIEGRFGAWFAREDWKTEAFRDFDKGIGPDIYKVMAARVTGRNIDEIDRATRQLNGKVPELSCMYQGGVRAIQKGGLKAGIRIPERQANDIKVLWREENPAITDSWKELQSAAIEAANSVGTVVSALSGKVQYARVKEHGDFLFCRLPSTRIIGYANPSVRWKKFTYTEDGDEIESGNWGISYWAEHKGRLQNLDLYGGSQFNHIVQGTARDLLAEAMLRVEAAGYPVILHFHDEPLSEVDEDFGSAEHYEQLMSDLPPWAEGLPVATKAWEAKRYEK